MKSKIGIICCGMYEDKQFVTSSYIDAINKANGLPLLIPIIPSLKSIKEYVAYCDGFLFCGGDDITPLLYSSHPQHGIHKTNCKIDIFQLRIMKEILESEKPVLCICRGMQVLNVSLGGTIIQDLNTEPNVIEHMQKSDSRKDASHKVIIKPDSKLHRIMGSFAFTNSFHHQAIKRIGHNLIATGYTCDGVIESIELINHPFAIGVQWHPECMINENEKMMRLFQLFVFKCNAKQN